MKEGDASPFPVRIEWKNRSVVRILPTSTTNMTGFLIWWTGFNFLNESHNAFFTIVGSKSDRFFDLELIVVPPCPFPPFQGED
jgi:hypothetical protein